MRIALTVLCIVYAVLSLFALGTMNTQIEALQKINNQHGRAIKYMSEKQECMRQDIRAYDKLINGLCASWTRRFNSHKSWTYQHVSDLANQMSDLTDLVRGEETEEGITNGIDREETTEADTTE